MRKILLVDPKKCTGCRECMLLCSVAHYGEGSVSRARVFVNKKEDTMDFIQTKCVPCQEKPCIGSCPVECLSFDEAIGRISYEEASCIGCGICADTCPYLGIRMDKPSNKPLICDLCDGDPNCAKVCPSEAITTRNYSKENEDLNWRSSDARLAKYNETFGG